MDTYSKAQEAKAYVNSKFGESQIKTAIITGTGLSGISDEIKIDGTLSYGQIPHLKTATVSSHDSKLIKGVLGGKEVYLMLGRFHYYEGFEMDQITFPVRMLQALGVENLIFLNATGGLNAAFNAGDIVVVKDHIYLMPINPLRGENDQRLGPRFPDMSAVYSADFRAFAERACSNLDENYKEGVYVCWQGPSLETPAEYGYLHQIGADLVGMSTIPEVIVAKHASMKVMVLSVVTNVCYPLEKIKETTIEEVIETAQKSIPKLNKLIKEIITQIDE